MSQSESPSPDRSSGQTASRLWLPVLGIGAALLAFGLFYVYPGDSSGILYLIFVVPLSVVVSISLIVFVILPRNRRHRSTVLRTVLGFWVISIPLALFEFWNPLEIRGVTRWFVESRGLKQQVLNSSGERDGELKSMDWDGWGMFSQDTEIYLVFDPADSLADAARQRRSGKFDGIPCSVRQVRRLEDHWYSVVFYTGETWGGCNGSDR